MSRNDGGVDVLDVIDRDSKHAQKHRVSFLHIFTSQDRARLKHLSEKAYLAIDDLLQAAELVVDLASDEWQESDGSRRGAVGSDGKRLMFVAPELLDELRAAVIRAKGKQP